MAENKPAPPPAPKPASSASVKAEPVAAKKNGFDIKRPFRYAYGFMDGTATATFDGIANWGRKASWMGMGVAALALLGGATGGILLLGVGWLAGLAAGAVAGGAVGLVTGGVRGMDREDRKDKYAEDLLKKAQAKSKPVPAVDYRDAHREYKRRNDYFFDRLLQQEREVDRDTWQSRVSHSRGGHGKGFF